MKQGFFGKKNLFFFLAPLALFLTGFFVLNLSFKDYSLVQTADLEAIITDGEFDLKPAKSYFIGKPISPLVNPIVYAWEQANVLGDLTVADDSKWIEVDLSQQKLKAWQGSRLVYEFPVSTGKRQWGAATPVGTYRIWIKLRYAKMTGGEGNHYYNLTNVPCTQYFNKGFGIHGAWWHDNFGHPMSHGCVNMDEEAACKIFYWTSPQIGPEESIKRPSKDQLGTRVVVHGQTPLD